MALPNLSTTLSAFFSKLFSQYQQPLKLKHSDKNLSENDHTAEDKSYIEIEYYLGRILEIFKKLKKEEPTAVHFHLREFNILLQDVRQLLDPNHPIGEVKKIGGLYKKAMKFIAQYDYKLRPEYQANLAILLVAMLYESSKESLQANIAPGVPVLKDNRSGKELSLADIANMICQATGKEARNIQFIAIGVAKDGRLYGTTNYHTPVVYPLECLLSKDLYQHTEKMRHRYKMIRFNSHIHAETMMASLKEVLDVESILLIDGAGRKAENCLCCAHYLTLQGFSSEPHMERLHNYTQPTALQIKAAADWLFDEVNRTMTESPYHLLDSAKRTFATAKKAQVLAHQILMDMVQLLPHNMPLGGEPLTKIFEVIKGCYPHLIEGAPGRQEVYFTGRTLASPEQKTLPRIVVRRRATMKRHPTCAATLFADGRIQASDAELRATDPQSPRSRRLVEYGNRWLECGQGHSGISENRIVLQRK